MTGWEMAWLTIEVDLYTLPVSNDCDVSDSAGTGADCCERCGERLESDSDSETWHPGQISWGFMISES